MTLADQLAALRKEAIPGPWDWNYRSEDARLCTITAPGQLPVVFDMIADFVLRSNAALIVFLVNHAAEIESALRAQEERGGLEGLVYHEEG